MTASVHIINKVISDFKIIDKKNNVNETKDGMLNFVSSPSSMRMRGAPRKQVLHSSTGDDEHELHQDMSLLYSDSCSEGGSLKTL